MSGPDPGGWLERFFGPNLEATIEAEADIIAAAGDEADRGGVHGVIVWRDMDGALLRAAPSETVPFGWLYEHTLDRPTCDMLALKPLVSPVLPRSDP